MSQVLPNKAQWVQNFQISTALLQEMERENGDS